jgi:hypothetical protein
MKNRKYIVPKLILDKIAIIFRYIYHRVANKRGEGSVYKILWERAYLSSADYIEKNINNSLLFPTREDLWDYVFEKIGENGLRAEFGVHSGYSINYFASKNPKINIYGFDSFEGLNEDWPGSDAPAGHFNLLGVEPRVENNVVLVKGWFNDTVSKFVENNAAPFDFIHLDADTYESTLLVLELCKTKIVSGTILVFDEYLGYPNWEKGEYLAFQEFIFKYEIQYNYLAFSSSQCAVKIH